MIRICAIALAVLIVGACVVFVRVDDETQSLLVGTVIGLVIGCAAGVAITLILHKPRTNGMGECEVKPRVQADGSTFTTNCKIGDPYVDASPAYTLREGESVSIYKLGKVNHGRNN